MMEHDYFNDNSKNMKLLWIGIKSIISVKNYHVNVINKLKGQCKIYYMTWPVEIKTFWKKSACPV